MTIWLSSLKKYSSFNAHPDALDRSALHLAFHVAGMDCFAGVLQSGITEDVHLAGLGVHFHIHQVDGERRAGSPRIDVGPAYYRPAGAV